MEKTKTQRKMQQKLQKKIDGKNCAIHIFDVFSSWWFQPLWNLLVKMGSSSPIFGVKIENISSPSLPHTRWVYSQRALMAQITMPRAVYQGLLQGPE